MERLTLEEAIKYIKEVVCKNRKNKEKNTIVIPNSFISSADCAEKYEQVAKWLKELKFYKEAEEQGLLVRLPCNVGDTVFRINEGAKNPIIELTVTQINIIRKSYNLEVVDRDGGELMYFKNDIGNSIFLTREEAENKLEEMKKNDNRKKN